MKEPKLKTVYVCSNCGETSPRWMGRCPSCGSWNTMNEDVVAEAPKAGTAAARQAAAARPEGVTSLTARRLSEISTTEEKSRILTGISELDRVLGGGIVLGGVVLLSGEPGVGKSTMLLQLCGAISNQHSVLYITGEESVRQVKLRAARLKVPQDNIFLAAENDVDEICGLIEKEDVYKRQVVGHHRALCLGVGLFQSLDLVLGHVDGAEDEVHLCGDLFHLGSVLHHHPLDALGHRGGHGPAAAHSLFIRFACAAARSSQDGQLEPGMVLQQRNKTLTHHTGCAYDTHFILFFHFQHLSFQKDEQCALWFAQRLENRHSMQYNRYCLYKFYNIIDAVPVSIIGKANAQYVKKRFLV